MPKVILNQWTAPKWLLKYNFNRFDKMSAAGFLTKEQCDSIVEAIKSAELNTSGEIRVHIESECSGDPCERAVAVFHKLGMFRTAARNGVLIYLAFKSHKVAIIGDEGINKAVPEGFWYDVYHFMSEHFKNGDFAGGLVGAIVMAGDRLKEFFPYQSDDVNEQSDEISFGK